MKYEDWKDDPEALIMAAQSGEFEWKYSLGSGKSF
jgi:hypothetical protein